MTRCNLEIRDPSARCAWVSLSYVPDGLQDHDAVARGVPMDLEADVRQGVVDALDAHHRGITAHVLVQEALDYLVTGKSQLPSDELAVTE